MVTPKINYKTLGSFFIIMFLLTIVCFYAAWGVEDGPDDVNGFIKFLSMLFTPLSFPALWLLTILKIEGAIPYFAALSINALMYSFLFERLMAFIKKEKRVTEK